MKTRKIFKRPKLRRRRRKRRRKSRRRKKKRMKGAMELRMFLPMYRLSMTNHHLEFLCMLRSRVI